MDLYESTLVVKEPLKLECDVTGVLYKTRDRTQTLCPERSPYDDFQSSVWGICLLNVSLGLW